MKKIYVLDTNVLLQDPISIFKFEDNDVVIPAVVLEEVDSKKRNMDEIGRNARHVSKLIDSLREKGRLHQAIELDNGGTLRIEMNHNSFQRLADIFGEKTNDNRILSVAFNLEEEERNRHNEKPVILVSQDVLMRVKADALGLQAQDYRNERSIENTDDLYSGVAEVYCENDLLNEFYANGGLPVAQFFDEPTLYPHQFVIIKDNFLGQGSAIGKVDAGGTFIRNIKKPLGDNGVWGIYSRNTEQTMALELLLRDDIPLVTMVGKAGTGKTLLALAASLHLTEDENIYKKLLVARAIVPVGNDIGFLPGEKDEKLRPWMQPIYDNLEYLFGTKKQSELDNILAGMGSIEIEALTYIRGRSIPEQFIIIDEAQNLSKHEMKTIITRLGEKSKIVIMGDPQQIDHPYLDAYNNGLTYVVEKFKEQPIAGHITLTKGERSGLAQLAADIL